MQQHMDDKNMMESILLTTKGACDLYLHGTIESTSPEVHRAFQQILEDTLCMQNDIYAKMSAKGWYSSQQAQQQQVDQTRQQYASQQ